MKRIIQLVFLFLLCTISNSAQVSQLKYLGLKKESNVRVAMNQLAPLSESYWIKSQIIDDFVYVPTLNGIYRKNLSLVNDTLWSLYAFEGVPIRDFIKHNDSILAITTKAKDSLMLLSPDNGKTYVNYTSDFFFKNDNFNIIWVMAMNPLNYKKLIVLHSKYGTAKSTDFGNNWTVMNTSIGGYQNRFAGFNPNDTTNIFFTGEFPYFDSFIYTSYNNGSIWKLSESIASHCTQILAFHPTNPDIIVSGGEGRIAKSIDRGLTWKTVPSSTGLYITGLVYDTDNPNILYASGAYSGSGENIKIYKSIDGGDTWKLFYTELIKNSDGVMDIHLYKNKLIIYTLVNGVYFLDLSSTSVINPKEDKIDLIVYPDQSNSILYCKSAELFDYACLIDISGRIIKEYKPQNKEFSMDISSFSNGVYLLQLKNNNGNYSRKIIIR